MEPSKDKVMVPLDCIPEIVLHKSLLALQDRQRYLIRFAKFKNDEEMFHQVLDEYGKQINDIYNLMMMKAKESN